MLFHYAPHESYNIRINIGYRGGAHMMHPTNAISF